jgi:stage II sporulation protein D
MKQKIIKLILLTLLFSIIMSITAFAFDIRIRIRSPRLENEYFSISSPDSLILSYDPNGNPKHLFSLETNNIIARISGYYSSYEGYKYYSGKSLSTDIGPYSLKLNDYTSKDYTEIQNMKNNLKNSYGINTYIYTDGGSFTLWYGQFISDSDAQREKNNLKDKYNIQSSSNDLEPYIYLYDKSNNILACLSNDYNFYVYNSNEAKNYVNIDGKAYRGGAGFYILEESRLLSINKVILEDYLKGVVASEMPASWHLEALKAQAVAARTYAVANISPNYSGAYDMADNQNSQVYNGISGERESTNLAISETEGKLIYYNNRLIEAYYHSTSGGSTDNSENVWTYALGYIRGVEDPYSNISPYTDWNINLSESDLISSLKSNGYNATTIYAVNEKEVSEFNRVIELSILTDIGELILKKEEVRKVIGYSTLKSTWYNFVGNNITTVLTATGTSEVNLGGYAVTNGSRTTTLSFKSNAKVLTSAGTYQIPTSPTSYTVYGKGFGHGLGLSQYGAKAMADSGFNYEEILKYYYTGVEIK